MSLRLIYGRAGSGKSFFCLRDIKERLQEGGDRPMILLVPEQFSLQAEKSLVSVIGTGGIMQADVLTFRRMAHRVFNEVGGITRSLINSAGKCMILYKIIESRKDQLRILAKAARQPGFVNTMCEMVSEFKRYNITPQMLRDVSGGLPEGDLLKGKTADLATLYEAFEDSLHQQYMDSEDELTLLAQKLDKSRQFEGAEIWIDEFAGFTPQEYRVIETLLRHGRRINVTVCADPLPGDGGADGTSVFSPAQHAVNKLLALAGRNHETVDKPMWLADESGLPRFKESAELAHLEKNFFSFPYRTYQNPTSEISIFTSTNIYAEVEETAREVLRLVRDEGFRYRDITVVTRNLEGYRKLVAAIFDQHGIPYFIDTKRDLNSHPLVTLVSSALEILTSQWSYEAVFRYVKTGLTNIGWEEADVLENYVLAWGIRGNRWIQEEAWNFSTLYEGTSKVLPEKEQEYLAKVNNIRGQLTSPLLGFRSRIRGKRTAREYCTALYEFLCELQMPERIEQRVEHFRQRGQLDLANEYSQVWNILMEVFDQIVEVMGEETLTLDRFTRILTIGFSEYKIGLIPPAMDQVLVGSIERSKSHEVGALFIIGVNDGVFPSTAAEEGILSDRDRESLREAGVELALDTRARAFEEQYLVYRALSTPGRVLRLSYPIANAEGRTMRPSMIISRVKKIFPLVKEYSNLIHRDTDEENLSLVAAPAPVFNQVISAVRKHREGFEINPLWWDVYHWFMQQKQWQQRCTDALCGLTYTNQTDRINPEKIGKLYGNPVYSSVSRFERYATCPFSYYVQYGLKAGERKVFKLSAPDLGTFMHEVLDAFAKELDREGMTWRSCEREWCADAVSRIVDGLLESMGNTILSSSQRYRYLAERLKRVLTRSVWLIAEHIRRSGFEPFGYEMAFGENERFPPITVELPSGQQIKLTGRIDRLDVLRSEEGTYLRIVDYKSGTKDFRLADVYYGLQVQLITYMDAVWEAGAEDLPKPILPGGVLYFRVDDPVVRGTGNIEEEAIEKAIMKQLKMKGLLLADVKLIKEMDRQIDGDSLIIPARLNKGDVLGRSSAATAEQFQMLRRYVKKLLAQIGEEMLGGNVSIQPYKNKRVTSCQYCNYSAVCQFDSSLKDNKYKVLADCKDEEVWEKIKVADNDLI